MPFSTRLMSCTFLSILLLLFTFHHTGIQATTTNLDSRHIHSPGLAEGVLLIADKKLVDPNFEKTVVLITGYDSRGTSGLVINRRTKIPAAEVLPELKKIIPELTHLYLGGPVAVNSINILIKSETVLATAKQVTNSIYLISTLAQFNQLEPENIELENVRLFTGLAGWAPGQLETELIRGDWYLWYADAESVFNPAPENIWHELIQTVSAKWVYFGNTVPRTTYY